MSVRRKAHLVVQLARLALLVGTLAWFSWGCSKDNSAAPTGTVGGPSLSFTFPGAAVGVTPGTSHTFQFTTVGSWNYHCTPHQSSGMSGTVNVSASSMVDSALIQVGPSDALVFSPPNVTIKQNGTVRWVNMSSMTIHTVTRP